MSLLSEIESEVVKGAAVSILGERVWNDVLLFVNTVDRDLKNAEDEVKRATVASNLKSVFTEIEDSVINVATELAVIYLRSGGLVP